VFDSVVFTPKHFEKSENFVNTLAPLRIYSNRIFYKIFYQTWNGCISRRGPS